MPSCKPSPTALRSLQRLCAIIGAVAFMVLSFFVIFSCAITAPVCLLNPLSPGIMKIVWAVWNFAFGFLIICLQFNMFHATLAKYAGFLETRVGRSFFYLYCGNCAGASAATEKDPGLWLIVAYCVFAMFWFVGIYELCCKSASDRLPAEMPSLAPLGATLCSDGADGSSNGTAPAVTISVSPEQAAATAKFAARNASTINAWAQAVAASGGASGSTDRAGLQGTSSAHNPFFAR